MTDTISLQSSGAVGRLTLNHPERHNALGREQREAICNYLDAIQSSRDLRVLIVTGAGDKTFCAGASLQELSAGELADNAFQEMTARMAALSIPTICAFNGDVFGGGVELAASCDFRIGIEGMRMRVPAAALGLCYPAEGMVRLVECLGPRAARRVLMAAEELDAVTLREIGFLDYLVPPSDLERRAAELAERIAALAPLAVQGMKRILRQTNSFSVDASLANDIVTRCLESDDLREGLAAQRERRAPDFRGC